MSRCVFHDGGVCNEPCINAPKYSLDSPENCRFGDVLCRCEVIGQSGEMSDWIMEEILGNTKIKAVTNERVCLITNGQD